MARIVGITVLSTALLFSVPAYGEWRVDIESKTVGTGQTGVTVEFTVYNDLPLVRLTVPVIVRELNDPPIGAFWTGTLPLYCDGEEHGVEWFFDDGEPGELCSGDLLMNPHLYDGISPDQFYFDQGLGLLNGVPEGTRRLRLTFDVTGIAGQFEFDTAMFTPSLNRIYMIDDMYMDWGPSCIFNKGIITITDCDCTAHGDLNLDGSINPADVVCIVNYVYKDVDDRLQIPSCPGDNGDWNCDGNVNPADVVYYVNYVYKAAGLPRCNPCPGGMLPDLTLTSPDLYFNPNPVEAGRNVWLWVRIHNVGWDTAFAPTIAIYQGDPDAGGILLGNTTTIDLPPGANSGYYGGQFTFSEAGAVEIYGVADEGNLISETNENNNQAQGTLEVTAPSTR